MLQAMMVSLSLMSATPTLEVLATGELTLDGRPWDDAAACQSLSRRAVAVRLDANAERIHQQLKSEEDEASRR